MARSGRYKRVFFAEYETQPCYPFYIISDISTHTPLTGNNSTLTPVSKLRSTFQSTLSSLRAIQNGQQHQPSDYFNPRSPHRERRSISILKFDTRDFNPRSPHRERLREDDNPVTGLLFQSTLPSLGATEHDITCTIPKIFQSTLPSQGATKGSRIYSGRNQFQSTLPSQGATCTTVTSVSRHIYFNPRSPHRERQQICT